MRSPELSCCGTSAPACLHSLADMGHDDVERVLTSIEGRAFSDAADAMAALAEASRAIYEAWTAPGTPASGERQESLRGWIGRLLAVAERAALYVEASGLTMTVGFPAGVSITVDLGSPARPHPSTQAPTAGRFRRRRSG